MPNRPYGYDVVVEFRSSLVGREEKTVHYVGNETTAKRKAMMRPHAYRVVSTSPVTWDEWVTAYGNPRIRM